MKATPAQPSDRFFWMIHLLPTAPRCNVPADWACRNRMGTLTLESGMKQLLHRLEVSPADVRWELDRADPALVRIADRQPMALIWAGPELNDLHAMLAALRAQSWLPQSYVQQVAA